MRAMAPNSAPKSLAWFDLLASASTPAEVVNVARDYLATWTPEEIARLPRACRPPRSLKFPEEIVDYAFALVKAHLDADSDSNGVTRMATFFAEASWRVAAAMGNAEVGADNDAAF
jgi:hypothetical protein